jgi:hypothetical protein
MPSSIRATSSAKLICILVLFCAPCFGQAWSGILASGRAVDWSGVGTTIPSGSWTLCNSVAPYSGTSMTINTAIAACGSNTYLLLQTGTFTLSTNILIQKSNVELRLSSGTTVNFTGGGSCVGSGTSGANICLQPSSGNYYDGSTAPSERVESVCMVSRVHPRFEFHHGQQLRIDSHGWSVRA